jgi:hypothetical protein
MKVRILSIAAFVFAYVALGLIAVALTEGILLFCLGTWGWLIAYRVGSVVEDFLDD